MRITHTVFKNEDLVEYATEQQLYQIATIGAHIEDCRNADDKAVNTYIVVNTDEPFIDEIINVLKRHGKWEDE